MTVAAMDTALAIPYLERARVDYRVGSRRTTSWAGVVRSAKDQAAVATSYIVAHGIPP